MPDRKFPFEAKVVHDLPDELNNLIGRVMVGYARLEHGLTSLTGMILQLNRVEARVVLREPRAADRLEMALDLFAIKDIKLKADTQELNKLLTEAASGRDLLAHSIWLQDPKTPQLYVRKTRGSWPKAMTRGERISRTVFPQSIPFGPEDCRAILDLIDRALELVDEIGEELDAAIQTFPERFRPPAAVLNHLGTRPKKDKKHQPPSSAE